MSIDDRKDAIEKLSAMRRAFPEHRFVLRDYVADDKGDGRWWIMVEGEQPMEMSTLIYSTRELYHEFRQHIR